MENTWRDEYCPNYGHIYCDCPFVVEENTCPGHWTCNDIDNISADFMAANDVNGDGLLNWEDNIEDVHAEELNISCDFNGDDSVDACEVHMCVVLVENNWRDNNCPDFGHVYCDCPFVVAECEGSWNCEDIYNVSL